MEDIATGGITNAYRRNYWQPLWIGCCEDHETELVQLPYHEHSKKNYDFTGRIDEHIDLIREHSKSARRSTFPSFDRYVKTRLAGQKQIPFLDSFNLDIACRLCETLGASLIAPETKLRRFAAEDWYTICQEGFNVVQAGENAFLDALAQLRRDATDGQTKYRQNLGPLYEWLRRARECKDVKRLKDCVSDFVFQSYPIKKGTQVLRRTCPETMNFHAASASEATGIYSLRMRKIVRQTETTSFRRDELEKIVASAEGSLNRKEACCFLGLPKRLFSILLRSEIVKKHPNPIDADRKYRQSDLLSLIRRVKANTVSKRLPNQRLGYVKKGDGLGGRPFAEVIQAILDGQLTNSVLVDDALSLENLQVDMDEVRSVFGLHIVFSRKEVSTILKVRTPAISHLIKDGYLVEKPGLLRRSYAHRLGICRQSVSNFQTKFITLGEFAFETGMHAPAVARLLRRTPVNEIDSSPEYPHFYLRADLDQHSADLRRVGIPIPG